ncbi:MAG: 4-hydroxybenzoate octaprenyltransferase [Rickettsiaceae bacterium]
MLAYNNSANLIYIPVFLIGSILARGAGCIINDIFDQQLDKKVARTKNRPLPSGYVTTKQAIAIAVLLLCCCLIILLSLTATAIYIGFLAFLLITIYPLMKRVTYFPQVFLGLTFNIGCLIGYAAIQDNLSKDAVTLYIACGFWIVAYDTIYAFMDIKDDKKVGIKSTAIFFEHKPYKLILAALYLIFFGLFAFAFRALLSNLTIYAIILCIAVAFWGVFSLDIKKERNCFTRFKLNNYIGFVLFLAILLEKL